MLSLSELESRADDQDAPLGGRTRPCADCAEVRRRKHGRSGTLGFGRVGDEERLPRDDLRTSGGASGVVGGEEAATDGMDSLDGREEVGEGGAAVSALAGGVSAPGATVSEVDSGEAVEGA
jgi:hypothetical protein